MQTPMLKSGQRIILYDGQCGFCNFWVQFLLKKDKKNLFLFASLQSKTGQEFLTQRNLENKDFNTLFYWKKDCCYQTKHKAIAYIAKDLSGIYYPIYWIKFLPNFIGQSLYDLVAKNRFKLKNKSCMLPSKEMQDKFLE